jgi:colanic acid biosynthesis glycosyl transferase WcaI
VNPTPNPSNPRTREPLKIVFFNRSYWPDVAATGQLLTELAADLVAGYGCEVTVVAGQALTVDGGGLPWWRVVRQEMHDGVRIVRANGTRLRPRRFAGRVLNYLSYFMSAAVASFGVGRPDVVVSLTDPPIIGLLALWTARRTGAKFVFLCEDIFPEVAVLLEDFHNETVNRVLDRINRHLLTHADAIVALGDRMRRRLVEEKGADPRRITIVHNWADCEAIAPASKDNAFSRAHGLADAFVVMHSGNIGLSQNLGVILDAAERLRDRRDLVFVLVGDGAKRQALEANAAARRLDNVRFLPYQPKAQLDDSFGAADVFIVSLQPGIEGYIVPSKVYGILAAGRPFIAAVDPSCEVAAIARDHGCGLLAAPGDAADLASKILALYEDRPQTDAMGARARDAAWLYDRRRAVKAYYELCARVTGMAGVPDEAHV